MRIIPPGHVIICIATTTFRTMLTYGDIYCIIKGDRERKTEFSWPLQTHCFSTSQSKVSIQGILYHSSILYSKIFIWYGTLELNLLTVVGFRTTFGHTQTCNPASSPIRLFHMSSSPFSNVCFCYPSSSPFHLPPAFSSPAKCILAIDHLISFNLLTILFHLNYFFNISVF